MRRKMRKLLWIVPLGIVGMALFIFIGGEIVLHLWNWLLPPLFGWHVITFWQALAILILCRILFGGHGFRGRHRGDWGWRRRRWAERWEGMTPEERERLRERWRNCGPFGPSEPKPTA